MASEVTKDGRVLAPLNITAPAPILNLRGFRWDTVDHKILGPQPSHDYGKDELGVLDDEQSSAEQAVMAADFKTPVHAEAIPPPFVAPQLPEEPTALPPQVVEQLGHISRHPAPPPPADFPLAQFRGAYAGNGFNLIFRPRSNFDTTVFPVKPTGPDDNILELNLTTEQLTFGGTIGKIPNRGLGPQADINLGGLPYLQTIQDVTNTETGKGDRPDPVDIHFEPGMWLNVPAATTFQTKPSVVRMASIPHGTTINAQGFAPAQANTVLGGISGPPIFADIDTTPFDIQTGAKISFPSMDASNQTTFRIPQNLEKFNDSGTQTITTNIIKNPINVLKKAIQGQIILETITFEVSTGPPAAQLNGGGTANIAFLAGKQVPISAAITSPIADAAFMKSTFWIETVLYQVVVPKMVQQSIVLLRPTMPSGSTAPTPVFAITTPPNGVPQTKTITIPGIQIQYAQTVNLNFGPPRIPNTLGWPHVSVATLVPTGPQPFQMT